MAGCGPPSITYRRSPAKAILCCRDQQPHHWHPELPRHVSSNCGPNRGQTRTPACARRWGLQAAKPRKSADGNSISRPLLRASSKNEAGFATNYRCYSQRRHGFIAAEWRSDSTGQILRGLPGYSDSDAPRRLARNGYAPVSAVVRWAQTSGIVFSFCQSNVQQNSVHRIFAKISA